MIPYIFAVMIFCDNSIIQEVSDKYKFLVQTKSNNNKDIQIVQHINLINLRNFVLQQKI